MSQTHKDKPKAKCQFDVKCKNKCGFYGNPEWQGYCSKCHKELHLLQKSVRSSKVSKKVHRSHSDVQDHSLNLGFGKFEEKKKHQVDKRSKTIKSIIKRNHTLKETSSQSSSKDFFEANDVFQFYKDQNLNESTAKDVIKQIRIHSELISKHENKQSTVDSELMQDFYNFMFSRCETHPLYQEMTPEQIDALINEIEKQYMTRMYRSIFQQISTEYEEKDLALQNRIRSLNWVTAQHLFLNLNESNPDVRELIDKAITDALQVDSESVPQGKISCIVNCSKNIFQILNLCSGGEAASADEFLPAMVYIILRANPARLQSNIKYITNYSIPTRLRSGEGAYYFTNLCCAVAFIEDLTSESLNMIEDEFQRYMSGEIPASLGRLDSSYCEGVCIMKQKEATLAQIQDSNNKVLSDLHILKEDILKFQDSLHKCQVLPSVVFTSTPYIVPANTDMSFIPKILHNRIVFAPVEDILIEIDPKVNYLPLTSNEKKNKPKPLLTELSTLKLDGSSTTDSDISNSFTANNAYLSSLQSLKVDFPYPSSTLTMQPLPVSNINETIQNLEYPTELFPDESSEKSSTEFGPYEGYEACEQIRIADPLSPESGFTGESLNLPPPLQPVVVQTAFSADQDKNINLL